MNNQISFSHFVDLTGSDSLELLDNARIAELTGLTEQRVWKSTRTKTRYILRAGKSPLDLAMEVTEKFFSDGNVTPDQCKGVAVSHTSHVSQDYVVEIADAIKSEFNMALADVTTVSFGCVGFPKVVADVASKQSILQYGDHYLILNIETPDRMMDSRDPKATPIFAAGATATSLRKGDGHKLLFAETEDVVPPKNPGNTDVFHISREEIENFSGQRETKLIFRMNGELAYENGAALIEQAARDSLHRVMADSEHHGRRVLVVSHQPNAKMVKGLDKMVSPQMMQYEFAPYSIPNLRFVNGMEGMGNVISATIPSVLARINCIDGIDAPNKGDIVLFPAAGICMRDPGQKMSVGRGAMIW